MLSLHRCKTTLSSRTWLAAVPMSFTQWFTLYLGSCFLRALRPANELPRAERETIQLTTFPRHARLKRLALLPRETRGEFVSMDVFRGPSFISLFMM